MSTEPSHRRHPITSRVGKRGTIVMPAALRRRYGFSEGSLVIAEEREDGVLIRPVAVEPLAERLRAHLLEATNAAYAAEREHAAAWRAELEERAVWDSGLGDGLAAGEVWTDADRADPESATSRE